jgi:acyl-CoA thioester hydrolase
VSHVFPVRIYHEDTDHTGVVYHASYLRLIERARSEWARGLGLDQGRLLAEGTALAVRRMEADWLAPARYDDLLEVETGVEGATGARLVLLQEVRRGGLPLFRARVTLAAVGAGGRPRRLPGLMAGAGGEARAAAGPDPRFGAALERP